eukprot:3813330-Alexandrium_andersonii.AAC.1
MRRACDPDRRHGGECCLLLPHPHLAHCAEADLLKRVWVAGGACEGSPRYHGVGTVNTEARKSGTDC